MNESPTWHIIKRPNGHCEIVLSNQLSEDKNVTQQWGPFTSPDQAIARRVGLIRSGKCQPS